MKMLLAAAVEKKMFRALDVQLADYLTQHVEQAWQPCLLLLVSWLSWQTGRGHVCIDISQFTRQTLQHYFPDELGLVARLWQAANHPTQATCLTALSMCPSVSDVGSTHVTPLVLDGQRLYLQRMWLDETLVANYFKTQSALPLYPTQQLAELLDRLFQPHAEVDWQKIAVAIALTGQKTIISGGPGTGKTTTVAKLLAALVLLEPKKLRIVLAAPTGKAAARLTESLQQAITVLPEAEMLEKLLPKETMTLHRLLGATSSNRQFLYHADNPLHLDVLIIDEASMIDLTLMANVIAALPAHARVVLLGDREQLASVEAGAVLGDLCSFVQDGYSQSRSQQLSELTGYAIPNENEVQHQRALIADNICLLRKSFRFDEHSGIGQLARAVNLGDTTVAFECFQRYVNELTWNQLLVNEDYQTLLQQSLAGYQHYFLQLKHQVAIEMLLASFNQFQVLCALREGPFGVEGLNRQIQQGLMLQGWITSKSDHSVWYHGRPVMILHNDANLGLYNGDVGIAVQTGESDSTHLLVYFRLANGTIKGFSPYRLPEHETAFAMTVHKSQGSEFEHVLCVLPDQYSTLLTRELIYTAITRAKKQFSLFARSAVLVKAVETVIYRQSGLIDKLKGQAGESM